jgi:hypothetical protein
VDGAGGRGDRAGERSSHLLFHPAPEHRPRALLDPQRKLVGGDVEADDQRRAARLAAPEPVLARA